MAPYLLLILGLVPLIICEAVWELPRQSQLIPVNSKVDVKLTSNPAVPAAVTMSCGLTYIDTKSIMTNQIYKFDLPTNYTGTCAFTCSAATTIRIIIVQPVVTFVAPTFPPAQVVPAGTSVNVVLSYEPVLEVNPVFEVGLECIGNPGELATAMIEAGIPEGGMLSVPKNFFGDFCVMFILNGEYIVKNTPQIVVSQPLEFVQPVQNSVSVYPDPIKIYLKVDNEPDVIEQVYAMITCTESGNQVPFAASTYTEQTIELDSSFYGACTFSVFYAPPQLALPEPVTIYRKFGLTFAEAPSDLYAGNPFTVLIELVPKPTVEFKVNMGLICNGNMMNYVWKDVKVSEEQILMVPSLIRAGTHCRLQTLAQNEVYSNAVSPVNLYTCPYGGKIELMTPEQIDIFLQLITGNPESWII